MAGELGSVSLSEYVGKSNVGQLKEIVTTLLILQSNRKVIITNWLILNKDIFKVWIRKPQTNIYSQKSGACYILVALGT